MPPPRRTAQTVRTLADQVRKREKLKKQLLLASKQEWQMRRQLGLPPGNGVLPQAPVHTHALAVAARGHESRAARGRA